MGKQQFTEIQKAKILLAISIKPTLEEARRLLASKGIKVSISGMSKIRARYKTTRSVSRKRGLGLKRRTTTAEDKFIVKAALKIRRCSILKLTRKLSETSNITVSRSTVTRRLKEKGFARRTSCYRPKLTDGQKASRLAFAQSTLTVLYVFGRP